jgi:hypothetical protein
MNSFFRSSSSRSHILSSSDSSDNVINNKEISIKRDSEIMMIIRDYELNRNYEINKEKLRKDFMSSKYDDKRIWFFNTFSKYLQNQIRTRWYNDMNETKMDMYFFPWFERNYAKINIREDNTTSRIKNSQTNTEYSPSESTTLTHLQSQIIVSPLKVTSLNDDNKNMNNIIQQNNDDKNLLPNEIIHKENTPNESLSLINKESQLVTPPPKKVSSSNDNNIIQQNNFTNTCIINLVDNNFTNTCIRPLDVKLERIENQEKENVRLLLYETPPNLQFSLKNNNT